MHRSITFTLCARILTFVHCKHNKKNGFSILLAYRTKVASDTIAIVKFHRLHLRLKTKTRRLEVTCSQSIKCTIAAVFRKINLEMFKFKLTTFFSRMWKCTFFFNLPWPASQSAYTKLINHLAIQRKKSWFEQWTHVLFKSA